MISTSRNFVESSNYFVSVIIPNHNYGRFLSETINSVIGQTFKRLEIIVIDNESTDNSREVLASFGSRIKVKYQGNYGQANARNVGLSLSKGNVIAFLDADDCWQPNKLRNQLELINDSTQLIYSGAFAFDSNNGSITREIRALYRGDCRNIPLTHPGVTFVPCGESSAIITRKIVEQVGLFDESLSSASGWDYFRRCSMLTRLDFTEEPQVMYREHRGNMSKNQALVNRDIKLAYKKIKQESKFGIYKKRAAEYAYKKILFTLMKSNLKRALHNIISRGPLNSRIS